MQIAKVKEPTRSGADDQEARSRQPSSLWFLFTLPIKGIRFTVAAVHSSRQISLQTQAHHCCLGLPPLILEIDDRQAIQQLWSGQSLDSHRDAKS
jgi:hypothetical protein